MTLDVLLATCASSRERTTSVRLEFFPTVSIFETVCPWVGFLSNKSKTDLCTRAPFLFVAHAAIRIHHLLVSRKTQLFGLRQLLGLVLVSGGPCVYDDTLERRFAFLRDGDQPDLTPLSVSPLLSPSLASGPSSLRSTYEAWKAGTLSRSSLADIAPPDAIAAYFSESPGLPSSRSTLRSLLKVSTVPAPASSLKVPPVPAIMLSRARSRPPSRTKKPLVLLRPRGDVSSAVTGAPPGSLSARCVSC